jgi:transcriptional regulator with XRE-family HTH domain
MTGRSVALRALRVRARLRQAKHAQATGASQSTISRIECGAIDGVSQGLLKSAFEAVGARCVVTASWRGGDLDRLVDERHALLSGLVVDARRRAGWSVLPEVSFSYYGERGSPGASSRNASPGGRRPARGS